LRRCDLRNLPDLRLVGAGGELLDAATAEACQAPGRNVLNRYGPTEATIYATIDHCLPGRQPTIGKPIDHARIVIADDKGFPLPPGLPERF